MNIKSLSKIHTLQHDQSDCGVTCLLTVLKFFKSLQSLERLRELSGTTKQGTTLLGLLQGAQKIGLDAEGFEADILNLKECNDPSILHIIKENRLQHFVVCFGFNEKENSFLISDPAESKIEYWSVDKLELFWKTKTLLLLKSTQKLETNKSTKNNQRRWLLSLIKDDFNILGLALLLGLVIAVLGLSTALFSQKLIDNILPSKDYFRLTIGIGALSVLLIGKGFFSYIRQSFLLRQSKDFNIRIIDRFLGKLLQLPKSFFDNRKTGDLIARMNDTQRIQRTISNLVSSVMIDFLLVVVATTAIFILDWQIGLIAITWIPIFTIIVFYFHPKVVESQKNVMKAYAYNESNYVDTIQGVGIIKTYNKQQVFSKKTKSIYSIFQESILYLGKVVIKFGFVTEITAALFIVGVISWSSLHVLNETLTIGGMIAILQLIALLMASAIQLAATNISIQEAKVAFERMMEFVSIDSEYDEKHENPKSKIIEFTEVKIDQLSFRFPGRKPLLTDISLSVKKGEWIAILGESGCGKSTISQILQKFFDWESGEIKVNEIDLDMIAYENWRSFLGVVPQDTKIFNASLVENILMGDFVTDINQLESFFKLYGFDQFFIQFPNGYATLLGEEGVNISGGQKQLVALARALYHSPQLLLLDEPTAALDRNTEKFVLTLLEKIKNDVAIITFTHKLKTAKKADRIYLIQNGKIEKHGQHKELMQSRNLYSNAWNDLVEL